MAETFTLRPLHNIAFGHHRPFSSLYDDGHEQGVRALAAAVVEEINDSVFGSCDDDMQIGINIGLEKAASIIHRLVPPGESGRKEKA